MYPYSFHFWCISFFYVGLYFHLVLFSMHEKLPFLKSTLLVMNSFSSYVFEKAFISPSVLKAPFTGFRILGRLFLSYQYYKDVSSMSSHLPNF